MDMRTVKHARIQNLEKRLGKGLARIDWEDQPDEVLEKLNVMLSNFGVELRMLNVNGEPFQWVTVAQRCDQCGLLIEEECLCEDEVAETPLCTDCGEPAIQWDNKGWALCQRHLDEALDPFLSEVRSILDGEDE